MRPWKAILETYEQSSNVDVGLNQQQMAREHLHSIMQGLDAGYENDDIDDKPEYKPCEITEQQTLSEWLDCTYNSLVAKPKRNAVVLLEVKKQVHKALEAKALEGECKTELTRTLKLCEEDTASWADLGEDDQKQWEILGWTSEGWDNNVNPPTVLSEGCSWDKLLAAEKEAAGKLGYDLDRWDSKTDKSLECLNVNWVLIPAAFTFREWADALDEAEKVLDEDGDLSASASLLKTTMSKLKGETGQGIVYHDVQGDEDEDNLEADARKIAHDPGKKKKNGPNKPEIGKGVLDKGKSEAEKESKSAVKNAAAAAATGGGAAAAATVGYAGAKVMGAMLDQFAEGFGSDYYYYYYTGAEATGGMGGFHYHYGPGGIDDDVDPALFSNPSTGGLEDAIKLMRNAFKAIIKIASGKQADKKMQSSFHAGLRKQLVGYEKEGCDKAKESNCRAAGRIDKADLALTRKHYNGLKDVCTGVAAVTIIECEDLVDHPWPKFIDMLGVTKQEVTETGMPTNKPAKPIVEERGAFDFLYHGDETSYLSFAGGGQMLSITHEISMATSIDLTVDFAADGGESKESGFSAGLAMGPISARCVFQSISIGYNKYGGD
jgi:hypothetical protein